MELKRTARDITGKRRDLPGHISVRTGIQAAAGYAFAMGILEKYRQAEGYDLPSASFVYLDPQGAEEEQEAVRELAAQISVLNRIRISYFNQSYERKYYWNVRLHCEQLLLRLSGSTALSREVRELRELYTELVREQESVFLQSHGGPEAQGYPGGGDRKEPGEGSGVRQSRKKEKELEQRLREILRHADKRAEKKTPAGVMRRDFISSLSSRQVPSAWKSQQAKQFFWNVQRSPRWEQELLFRAAGVRSLPALERHLAWIREENWGRELDKIKDRTQVLLQDQEILETIFQERFLQDGSSDAISSPDNRTAGTESAFPWNGIRGGFGREPGSLRYGEQTEELENYLKTLEYLNILSNTENEQDISRDKENILGMIRENSWLQALASGGRKTGGKSSAGGPGSPSGLETELAAMSGKQWMDWKKRLTLQILETILETPGGKETLEESEEEAGLSDSGKGSLQPPDAETGPLFVDLEPIRRPEEEPWNERKNRAERALDRAELWSARREFLDAAAEAVSYLGLEEWTRFKKELAAADGAEADASDVWQEEGPVLSWIRSRNGAEGDGSPEEMSEEKGAMIRALYDQAGPEWIFGASYGTLRERLEKSTILASYLQKEEEEERKAAVWPEEVKRPEPELAGAERNTQEADRGGTARRIHRLSGGAWRIFLEEFLKDGNADLVTQLPRSFMMGQASGQEEEIPLAEEKQRVLEYLERKTDQSEQMPAHTPVRMPDDRPGTGAERGAEPGGDTRETGAEHRDDVAFSGTGIQEDRSIVQMAEQVLKLLRSRELSVWDRAEDPGFGPGTAWRERAARALDQVETRRAHGDFLAAAAEAVASLGLEEWSLFKKELAAWPDDLGTGSTDPEGQYTEGPVLSWIRERGSEEAAGASEQMSGERSGLVQALWEQRQTRWIDGSDYRVLKTILDKSRVLSAYLQSGEDAAGDRKPPAAVSGAEAGRAPEEVWNGTARRIQRLSASEWSLFLEKFLEERDGSVVPGLPRALIGRDTSGQPGEGIPLAEEKRRVLEFLDRRAAPVSDHIPDTETGTRASFTVRNRESRLDQEVRLRNVFLEVREAALKLFSLPSGNRALWGHPSYLKTSASPLWRPEIQEERGEGGPLYNARAAAIHTLERLRQERIAVKREEESASVSVEGLPAAEIQRERTIYGISRTARPDMDGNSPGAGVLEPEKGRSEGPGEQTPPSYGPADMVVNQGAGAGRQPGGPQAGPQMSIKQEIQQQVKDEITDIQFITRSQTVTQEGSVQDRIQLENLLKRMESQEKELEKIKKDREAGSEGLAEARVSRNVMKKLQDQMQIERLRRGL